CASRAGWEPFSNRFDAW
nr:immunoglobulin heavy chain junction region [Macaca mulatta]MOV86880.1 immunoglobulin heavy chain junction region [Macaca mulatta]MOV87159.1 immunoglobulin heavy chain junction region [Macaca mulatta]MOV87252.1 immunoglobulin heavy chain junction region [Macaca mulatta]MOV87711.1 immunoglobulin heavy chain junction region [Macaca mulatta]